MEKITIYNIIKSLCDDHNINIAKLERELNFSEGSISKWKTSTPSMNKVLSVANYFNVSLDFITGRTPIQQTAESLLLDNDIISIQTAREQMTSKDKEKMMMLLKLSFHDLFTD